MSTNTIIIIVVSVIAVVIVLGVLGVLARQRAAAAKARHTAQNRERAGELRQEARGVAVDARRTEAGAMTARVDADEARLEADRLEGHANELEDEAARAQAAADQRISEADRIDPDVPTDGTGAATARVDDARAHRTEATDRAPTTHGSGQATSTATGAGAAGAAGASDVAATAPPVESERRADPLAPEPDDRASSATRAPAGSPVSEPSDDLFLDEDVDRPLHPEDPTAGGTHRAGPEGDPIEGTPPHDERR